MNIKELSLKKHYKWRGKIETKLRIPLRNAEDLSLAYTPGVASACLAIKEDSSKSFELTRRGNLVAVVTDGSAVLGLGDIGAKPAMPVMEGKCALFKSFADIDAIPICVEAKDPDEFIRTVYNISGSFGGINLEDISAPRCFEIEKKLKKLCDIPVFHDDQHGTAIVVAAALLNSLKLTGKDKKTLSIVINGAGAAGTAIARHLLAMGFDNIVMVDKFGIICDKDKTLNKAHKSIAKITNKQGLSGELKNALKNADVFIGVSAPNVLTKSMIKHMSANPIIFALSNPDPEITPAKAKEAGAAVVGTGRSDFPNQINNVLAFPGVFRGALNCRASDINSQMKIAASYAIANLIEDYQLHSEYILPSPFDKRLGSTVADAVVKAAVETKVARKV